MIIMARTAVESALSILAQLAIESLPHRFKWAPHNVIAHPLSEILFQLGCREASVWVHDITVPREGEDPWAI